MTILISTRKCFADYYKYILHKKARDLQLLAMPRLAVFRRSSGGLPAYKFDMQQLAWWPGYNRFSELWSTLSLSLLSTTQAVIYLHCAIVCRYLDGGVESGFRKVERGVYEKRLFHVKGKRNVRVCQVNKSCISMVCNKMSQTIQSIVIVFLLFHFI